MLERSRLDAGLAGRELVRQRTRHVAAVLLDPEAVPRDTAARHRCLASSQLDIRTAWDDGAARLDRVHLRSQGIAAKAWTQDTSSQRADIAVVRSSMVRAQQRSAEHERLLLSGLAGSLSRSNDWAYGRDMDGQAADAAAWPTGRSMLRWIAASRSW